MEKALQKDIDDKKKRIRAAFDLFDKDKKEKFELPLVPDNRSLPQQCRDFQFRVCEKKV